MDQLNIIIPFIGIIVAIVIIIRGKSVAEKEQIIKVIDAEKKENNNIIWSSKEVNNIKYLGGYHGYVVDHNSGKLALNNDKLEFRSHINYEVIFSIPISWVVNIIYDTSEKITLGRMLTFGILSLALKKKTYYLVIEYKTDKGLNNQLCFNCFEGRRIDNRFIDELNVKRNHYHSTS